MQHCCHNITRIMFWENIANLLRRFSNTLNSFSLKKLSYFNGIFLQYFINIFYCPIIDIRYVYYSLLMHNYPQRNLNTKKVINFFYNLDMKKNDESRIRVVYLWDGDSSSLLVFYRNDYGIHATSGLSWTIYESSFPEAKR